MKSKPKREPPIDCDCVPYPLPENEMMKLYCDCCGGQLPAHPNHRRHNPPLYMCKKHNQTNCVECFEPQPKTSECPTYPYYKDDDGNIVVSQPSDSLEDILYRFGMAIESTHTGIYRDAKDVDYSYVAQAVREFIAGKMPKESDDVDIVTFAYGFNEAIRQTKLALGIGGTE